MPSPQNTKHVDVHDAVKLEVRVVDMACDEVSNEQQQSLQQLPLLF